MLKPFLLVIDGASLIRQEVLDHLDTLLIVKNWFAFLPSAIFVISDATAVELSTKLRSRFPGKQFVITEIPRGGNDGWIDKTAWDFINNPKSSGRWPGGT